MSKNFKIGLIIVSIIIFGISLIPRFINADRFLPFYSIDENEIVEYAVVFMGDDTNPQWRKYGPLNWYILANIYKVQASLSDNYDEYVQKVFFEERGRFYTTARVLNSLFNVGMAVFAFFMAWKFLDRSLAWLAMPLLAFPFADQMSAFFARVDALLGFCTVAGLFFLLNYFKTKKIYNVAVSGLFIGLAIASKPLPGLLSFPTIFLSFVVVQFFDEQGKAKISLVQAITNALKDKAPYILLAFIFVGNFIGNPYSVLDYSSFIDEQLQVINDDSSYAFDKGYQISRFFKRLGIGFTIISSVALIYSLIKNFRNVYYFIVLSYPMVLFLAFANKPARNYFYMPIAALLCLAIAILTRDMAKRFGNGVKVLILVLVLAQPAYYLVSELAKEGIGADGTKKHTGLAATQWCKKNIPEGSKIMYYGMAAVLPKLVDQNKDNHANLGEYFMYFRYNYDFYKNHYFEAHKKYLESDKPTYEIMNIRNDLKEQEPGLYGYCMQNKFQYVISTKNLNIYPQFSSKFVQSFKKGHRYPFGYDIFIYKLY